MGPCIEKRSSRRVSRLVGAKDPQEGGCSTIPKTSQILIREGGENKKGTGAKQKKATRGEEKVGIQTETVKNI